ncbi:hypothetical protein D3C72_2181080 [compost metagenome]
MQLDLAVGGLELQGRALGQQADPAVGGGGDVLSGADIGVVCGDDRHAFSARRHADSLGA